MTPKAKNIIDWILTGIVALIFLSSAAFKLSGSADVSKLAKSLGISNSNFTIIGVVELISIILFLIPRTSILGTLLLVAYMGGVIATHLEHGQSLLSPILIASFVWIVAAVHFPELTQRILGKV